MAETTVNLGMLPQNRGEYSSSATYYKDNIVQYNGSSYICTAAMDLEHPSGITGIAPYDSDPATPNTGWAVFSNDSSGVGEGVYNVSVDHTTDNQPKVYASLSAALQDVPQAKKKGGMSIKFIQSSDNKYVQFRCMSDEFTTDVTQWQGMDAEPTDESKNLVESGGVKKAIDENIKMFSEKILFEELDYPIKGDGTFGDSQNKHAAIPVKPGEVYFLIAEATAARYCFATSDAYQAGGQIPLVDGTTVTTFSTNILLRITIPNGCSYLLFSAGAYYGTVLYKVAKIDIAINKLQFDRLNGFDYSFPATSYNKSFYFGFEIPANTFITSFGNNDSSLYLIPKDGSPYLIQSAYLPYKIVVPIIGFKPNSFDAGNLSIRVQLKSDTEFLMEEQLKVSGIDISFVNKSYAKIPFGRVIPSGTILNNGDYPGQLYVYDTNNVEYSWTATSHYFTAPADLESFRPTTNDAGRITTDSDIYVLKTATEKNAEEIQEIKEEIGEYNVSIKGAQVDYNTGQLYSMQGYNGYHWAEPIPLDGGDTAIYCEDQHIERYMFYSEKPVVGENTGTYLGFTGGLYGGEIIDGAKYVVITFNNQYVPTTQPFRVYLNNPNRIAYKVYFSQKMAGKKLVTIGDSLTAQCGWQFKLSRTSGMAWSFRECYFGLGYVNLNDGTYTLEDKSGDADYRKAYASAVGGTGIRPTATDSIFMRSFDTKYYQPDIIFVYAGENDPVNTWVTSGNTGTTPDEIVANEISYKTNAIDDSISAIAAYKGMIENLMENCPGAIIYIVSSMRVYCEIGKEVGGVIRFQDIEDVKNWENTARFPRVEYMRAIAKYYNLPLIDLWSKSGINDYNASQWYGTTAYDATQVHPAKAGYLRMADVMLQCL